MSYNATQVIRFIHQEFPKTGATVPPALTTALDTLRTTYDLTGLLPTKTPAQYRADLAAAAVAAVTAGRDLTTDKTIRALIAERQIVDAGLDEMIEEHASWQRAEIVRDYADELIDALHTAFDRAADHVEHAREMFGSGLDLSTAAASATVPAVRMSVWAHAYEATLCITKICDMWRMIVEHAHLVDGMPFAMNPLITADLSTDQLAQMPTGTSNRRAGNAAVLAGFPLSFATPAEFERRHHRIREEWDTSKPTPPVPTYLAHSIHGPAVVARSR